MPKSMPPGLPYTIVIYIGLIASLWYQLELINWVVASLSLAWLFFRANEVLAKPVEELIPLLGLEVPQTPRPLLLDIGKEHVSLHWSPPEHKTSVVKYSVRINGILIGEIAPHETAITITGLAPGTFFTIRVIAANNANFQASSDAIRVKTLDDSSPNDESSEQKKSPSRPAPTILPYKGVSEPLPGGVVSNPTSKDHAAQHQTPHRRSTGGRRNSPAHVPAESSIHQDELQSSGLDPAESAQILTERLEKARLESEDVERLIAEEEEEFKAEQQALLERRDFLRQQLRDRDGESKDLRKDVTSLERQSATAQNRKSNQEKTLQNKLREREKMQEDVDRWERETQQFEETITQLEGQKEELIETTKTKLEELRQSQERDAQANKQLEEQIREHGTRLKTLEEQRRKMAEEYDGMDHSQHSSPDIQDDLDWRHRMAELQHHYSNVYFEVEHARSLYHEMQQRLEYVSARRNLMNSNRSAENLFAPGESQIDPRRSSPNVVHALRATAGAEARLPNSASLHTRRPPSWAASLRTPSPFVPNRNSWMNMQDMPSQEDIDQLTGGAMTSPSAKELIPSGLLDNDGEELGKGRSHSDGITLEAATQRSRGPSLVGRLPHSLSLPGDPPVLQGLGLVPGTSTENLRMTGLGGETESRSPSLHSSPRDSATSFPIFRGSEGALGDTDGRSIHSLNVGSPRTRSSVFGSMFSRQRGKTTSDGPPLGSLKSRESQSLPRQMEEPSLEGHLAGIEGKRGIFGSMSTAMLGHRASPRQGSEPNDLSDGPSTRSSPFGMLGSKLNPWSRQPLEASRPTSVYSMDNSLPSLTSLNQPLGWNDSVSRSNSLRFTQHGNYSRSGLPSRRGSVHVDSVGLSDIDQDDDDVNEVLPMDNNAQLAPIGTKPAKNKGGASSKQLNPNARDFRSMFGRGDKKAEKGEGKGKGKKKGAETEEANLENDSHRKSIESLPPHSATDSNEDLTSSERGPPTPSDGGTAGSGTPQPNASKREFFKRHISRKGSSSKFSLSSLKSSSRKGPASDYDDDSLGGTPLAPSSSHTPSHHRAGTDSVTESPQLGPESKRSSTFSLSSFARRGKKTADAPSISETSTASETGDEVAEVEGGDVTD